MRLIETYFYRISLLVCLSSACYMTYLQFKYYRNNEDLASISYRRFNNDENDEYPTFTICFHGRKLFPMGNIFKKSHEIFNSTNATRISYQKYLRGLLKKYPAQFSDAKFDDVTLDIKENLWISSWEYIRKNGSETSERLTALPSYQDAEFICISKDSSYRKDVQQVRDMVTLNSSTLYDAKLMVSVFVHQKGKLMRNFKRPDLILRTTSDNKDLKNKIIDIGQVDILRKRETSKTPCDQNLKDEDTYIFRQMILKIGCIPRFWEKFAKIIALNQSTRICENSADYLRAKNQYNVAFDSLQTNDPIYKKPCTIMIAPTATGEDTFRPSTGILRLTFWYHLDTYRRIQNVRAYTSETLLGQVGGFVGMPYLFTCF